MQDIYIRIPIFFQLGCYAVVVVKEIWYSNHVPSMCKPQSLISVVLWTPIPSAPTSSFLSCRCTDLLLALIWRFPALRCQHMQCWSRSQINNSKVLQAPGEVTYSLVVTTDCKFIIAVKIYVRYVVAHRIGFFYHRKTRESNTIVMTDIHESKDWLIQTK